MRRLLPLLVLMPTLAFAQRTFQEKVTVTYIEVPVTVLGRDNAPVRGLTRANFEVRDGGVQRMIESFDAIDFAAAGGEKVLSPLNPASRRKFLLLFDLSHSSPISIGRAQDAARNFVARGVGHRDLVAVAAIDVNRGVRFLTSFTNDRNLLNAAIRDPRNFQGVDPLQLSLGRGAVPDEAPSTSAGGGDAKDTVAKELAADFARAVSTMDDAYRRSRVRQQVEMLRFIARSLQKIAGRKHIVLLSEGFDPRLVQGRIAGDVKEQTEENSAAVDGEVWKIDSDKRFGSASAQNSISDLAEACRRADVVIHAVDIRGLRVQSDVREGAKSSTNEGLFLLTNSTGGTVFRNSNDINADFDRLSRQHEVVYVLGFQAPVGRPGEFHELKVRLVNVPGARVQHRGGYYSAGGSESSVERTLSSAEVIINDIPQTDVDLAAIAMPFPTTGDRSQVPVILEISGDDLLKQSAKQSVTAEIYVYAFDEEGLVRDALFQRMHLDLAQIGERLRGGGVKFYGTLSLPPGRYAIRNLVRVAETDAKGFQRVNVVVPAADDVAVLQPLFFEEPGGWVMVKGGSNDATNAPYPFVLDGQAFVPSARANLRSGEPRLFTVWVYNAHPDELTYEVAPEAKLVSSTPDAEGTKYVFALERVPAGARELGVTIRKKGSTDERRVTVPIYPR